MNLYTKTIAFALAMHAVTVLASSTRTCKMLTDKDNAFFTSVAELSGISTDELEEIPIENILAPVDENFPWLSKCIASIDLYDIMMAMLASDDVGECIQALEASSDTLFPDGEIEFSESYFRDELCPLVVESAVPCLNNAFLPELAIALAKSGGCCSDMNAVITASFGTNLRQLATDLSKLVANVLCSTKMATKTNDVGEYTETCGYSLINNLVSGVSSDAELLMRLSTAIQIPEDQVCSAIQGESFRTTTGGSARFSAQDGSEPFGICYAPMQNLVSYVKAFPILKTLKIDTTSAPGYQLLSDLYAPGRCVRGDNLLNWVLSEDSVVMKSLEALDAFADVTSFEADDPESDSGNNSAAAPSGEASNSSSSSSSSDDSNHSDESESGSESKSASASKSGETKVSSTGSGSLFNAAVISFLSDGQVAADSADDFDGSDYDDEQVDTATFVRETLSPFVEPLASICVHFPSTTACSFRDDEISFAFSEVGSVPVPVSSTASTTKTSTSTTTSTTGTTPAPTLDATTGSDLSGASSSSKVVMGPCLAFLVALNIV